MYRRGLHHDIRYFRQNSRQYMFFYKDAIQIAHSLADDLKSWSIGMNSFFSLSRNAYVLSDPSSPTNGY